MSVPELCDRCGYEIKRSQPFCSRPFDGHKCVSINSETPLTKLMKLMPARGFAGVANTVNPELSACLQLLMSVPHIASHLFNVGKTLVTQRGNADSFEHRVAILHLDMRFTRLESVCASHVVAVLPESFYCDPLHDIADLLQRLLSYLDPNTLKIFEIMQSWKVVCQGCKHYTLEDKVITILHLQMPYHTEARPLESLFGPIFNLTNHLPGHKSIECPFCDLLFPVSRTFKVTGIPRVLILSLKRFHFDTVLQTFVKNYSPVTVPQHLTAYNANLGAHTSYNISAVIAHIGDVQNGRYIVYKFTLCCDFFWAFDEDEVTVLNPFAQMNDEQPDAVPCIIVYSAAT